MKRSGINVLIVEDDTTLGKALLEAFQRHGYSATLCNTSVAALREAQRLEFHCLVVDCVLPKMNGVDLVEEIIGLSVRKPKIFLCSGIYKDKSFIRDATARTGCDDFFVKPFELNTLLDSVDHHFRDHLNQVEESPIVNLYAFEPMTDGELIDLIEKEPTIHAFHVPVLLKGLQKTRLSGELTLITAVGDLNSIFFYDGRIFSVRTPDPDSYFGSLAVGFGFVSPDEVLEALKEPSRKLLGQKLIESLSLSPHAINVIMEEQLALRMSQCVQNSVVSLKWTHHKFAKPDFALNLTRFENLMEDWIQSKFEMDWIRSAMMEWGAYKIEGEFHPQIKGSMSLNELLAHPDFDSNHDLPQLFLQLFMRNAYLGGRTGESKDFTFIEARVTQMLKDQKEQDYFQVLGVGQKSHGHEINKAFADLKAVFDPKVLPADCPPGTMVKCAKAFEQIEMAYRTLSDDDERARYLGLLQNQRSQLLLQNEPIFRSAIVELESGHAKEAAEKFQKLLDRKLMFRDLRSYRIWAGLKSERSYRAITLDQVPPEERHSPAYMMAKGVFYRSKGEYQKALEAFRTAQVLDQRVSIAKHELNEMIALLEKNRGANRELIREATSIAETLFAPQKRRGA